MHVPRLHWVVADDSHSCSKVVNSILRYIYIQRTQFNNNQFPKFTTESIFSKTGLPYTHIMSPMPEYFRKVTSPPRGVANRRAALNWITKNSKNGIVYFGDDDNTFDLRLFDEIRDTKKISMFPVGLIGDYGISSPVVHNGKVFLYKYFLNQI